MQDAFAIADAHRGGGVRWLEAQAADHDARLGDCFNVGCPGSKVGGCFIGVIPLGEVRCGFGHDEHVFHRYVFLGLRG